MVVRARLLLAAASAAVVLRIVVGCSTAQEPASTPEAGPPGEAFTACQIQGYVSESEGGLCPEGTCPVLAFDTNGAQVPCCTSIVSGPGRCVDSGAGSGPDGANGSDAAADGGDAAVTPESGPEAADEGGTEDDAADGGTEAASESGAPEAGPSPDAADGE